MHGGASAAQAAHECFATRRCKLQEDATTSQLLVLTSQPLPQQKCAPEHFKGQRVAVTCRTALE